MVGSAAISAEAKTAVEDLADVLGWEIKRGEKEAVFGASFTLLGVSMDLSAVMAEGVLTVSNTAKARRT